MNKNNDSKNCKPILGRDRVHFYYTEGDTMFFIHQHISQFKTSLLAHGLLKTMAALYQYHPKFRNYLLTKDGWMNFSIGIKTKNDSLAHTISFQDGKVKVFFGIHKKPTAILEFHDEETVEQMLTLAPNEVLNLVLKNKLIVHGNLATMNKFNYMLSVLLENKHKKITQKKYAQEVQSIQNECSQKDQDGKSKLLSRKVELLLSKPSDNVLHLEDPFLSEFQLEDFERLKEFLEIHHNQKPEICTERAKLLTDWYRLNHIDDPAHDNKMPAVLRQAQCFRHIMSQKKAIIRTNDLIPGTTTTKEIGVILYPETHGTMIWGELKSVSDRILNPYNISEEDRKILHQDIFPFWEKRNIREWVRTKYDNPLCQKLDERFAVYFLWKTVAVSHTIADFPKLLKLGISGLIKEIQLEIDKLSENERTQKDTLLAMIHCLSAVALYAKHLADESTKLAEKEFDAKRKEELLHIANICKKVPFSRSETLHEALTAIWIFWTALHIENTNAGLSLGRMDQWLQPYFDYEIKKLKTKEEKQYYIKKAIELVGCFYLRCTDHLPLIPDIGNFLFGGSSSDQAITLGGQTPNGDNAVNDMTYIFLKVTEMLCLRDPNINARYTPQINSQNYLKRLCEVNYITSATPSIHNDNAVLLSLEEFNYDIKDARDWSAVGCVEPTLSGKHIGHTNSMMMNMVAALEMALYNGYHPVMNWDIGPKTGDSDSFRTFDDFFDAFCKQLGFLIDNACEYNNILGLAHQKIRPTPLLSSVIDGCITSKKDASMGGAKYNSSGAACIGLADVTDSLLAIKHLVFDRKKISFKELQENLSDNFADITLHSFILKKIPKFGSGDQTALDMANRVIQFVHDCYKSHTNYRGGPYTAGFWSMANHVAFGCLSLALPSGRKAYKPFTPGLTPQAIASDTLLDPIHDVALLNPRNMNNNIAFNVKIVPSSHDTHEQAVDHIYHYVKTYFDLGGMQMQLNVITSDILRDAMINPENYRSLLVRISGYNAYFVTLNREMQRELIERMEYKT